MNKFFTCYVSHHVTVMVTFGDILDPNWCIFSFDGVPGPSLIKFAEYPTLRPCCTELGSLPGAQFQDENTPQLVEGLDCATRGNLLVRSPPSVTALYTFHM